MKKILVILILFTLGLPAAIAQNAPGERDMQQWLNEVRGAKHDFLARELKLTRDQRDRFFEVYDKMDDEVARVNAETRALERKIYEAPEGTVTDTEYEAVTQAMLELKGKECEIEKTYYEQLKPILTKEQLFKLRRSEREFTMRMMRQHQKIKSNRKQ